MRRVNLSLDARARGYIIAAESLCSRRLRSLSRTGANRPPQREACLIKRYDGANFAADAVSRGPKFIVFACGSCSASCGGYMRPQARSLFIIDKDDVPYCRLRFFTVGVIYLWLCFTGSLQWVSSVQNIRQSNVKFWTMRVSNIHAHNFVDFRKCSFLTLIRFDDKKWHRAIKLIITWLWNEVWRSIILEWRGHEKFEKERYLFIAIRYNPRQVY